MSSQKCYNIKIRPSAMESLRETIKYIKNTLCNTQASIKLYDDFMNAVNRVAMFPYSAREIVNKAKLSYRKIFVGSYIVIYHIDDESKTIIITTFRYAPMSFGDLI